MSIQGAILILALYFLIATSSASSQSISDEEIDSLRAQIHNDHQPPSYDNHDDFGNYIDLNVSPHENPDISAETSFAIPPTAPVVGVSSGATFGIHNPVVPQLHHGAQPPSYSSHVDFNASPYEVGPKNVAASFGFEKPAVGISAETSFAVPAPIAVPPPAPVVGVSAATTFGIQKPVLGVSSGTSFGIQKQPLGLSAVGLLAGSTEILRIVEAFLKLKGDLINYFLAISNDSWPLIRAVLNLIIGKIPKLQAMALTGVSVLRKILEFAAQTFSQWNISLPGFGLGASGQTTFGVPHETYGVPSMQSIASFLEGYTRR